MEYDYKSVFWSMFRDSTTVYLQSVLCYLQSFCLHSLIIQLSSQSPDLSLQTFHALLKVTAHRQGQTLQPNPISHTCTFTSYFSMLPHIHVCTHFKLGGKSFGQGSRAYSLSAVRWMMVLLWSLIWSASFSLVCLERSRGRDNGQQ